ncbi:MAG: hypothetical protein ACW977_13195, partial [Candidatus Thorarchaeota archaeon]
IMLFFAIDVIVVCRIEECQNSTTHPSLFVVFAVLTYGWQVIRYHFTHSPASNGISEDVDSDSQTGKSQ